MRTLRMVVGGMKGWAEIALEDEVASAQHGGLPQYVIGIHGMGATGPFKFTADPGDEGCQRSAAGELQWHLEGYRGTEGDVADYLRAIEAFAD